MATLSEHAPKAFPSLPWIPPELFDRILDALWIGTSLLVYDSPNVISISYNAGPSPCDQFPKWLLTSKLFLSAGLAQFRRHAVITCIDTIVPLAAQAQVPRDKILVQSVREIQLDLALRCGSKVAQAGNTFYAHYSLEPRAGYWCKSTPYKLLVRDRMPGLEILTLLVEVQQLDWIGQPSSFAIDLTDFKTLGARWTDVRIKMSRPIIDIDARKIHMGSLHDLLTQVQTTVAHLGDLFTHLHTPHEQQQLEESEEGALDDLYQNCVDWSVDEANCPRWSPKIKNEHLRELLRTRRELSDIQRRRKDWIDTRTGKWCLEIFYPDSDTTEGHHIPQRTLNATGLYHFLVPGMHPTAPFCRDRSPKVGTMSWSCLDLPDTAFYTDKGVSGMLSAGNERNVCCPPLKPVFQSSFSMYSLPSVIKAPEKKMEFSPDWVQRRGKLICSHFQKRQHLGFQEHGYQGPERCFIGGSSTRMV